jgi:hypothetical protein
MALVWWAHSAFGANRASPPSGRRLACHGGVAHQARARPERLAVRTPSVQGRGPAASVYPLGLGGVVGDARPTRVRHAGPEPAPGPGEGPSRVCRAGVLGHAARLPPPGCEWPASSRHDRALKGNVLVGGGFRECPGSCRWAVLARRRRPGSAFHGGNALVRAGLPIAVPGHTTMGKSRRNNAVGSTGVLRGGFSVISRSPGSKRRPEGGLGWWGSALQRQPGGEFR